MSETNQTYSQLVERCKRGERKAQREIYEILSQKMFPICCRYMGDREVAKDVLHDGFITLFTKLNNYRGEGSFEGWARRIFVTTALMQLRKNDILREAAQVEELSPIKDEELLVNSSETNKLDAERLMELISSMPVGFRVVFNLYVIEGFSHKEISEMLGITDSGSRSQLSRAKDWLQERIKF